MLQTPADPLQLLLTSARRVGDEFCWPAHRILEVIDAFELLGLVVLGAELWQFDRDDQPTVVGWTEYQVPEGARAHRAAAARRLAHEDLLGHAGNMRYWINLTWASPCED